MEGPVRARSALVEEVGDDGGGRLGLFEVRGVPCAGDEGEDAVSNGAGEARGESGKAEVAGSGEGEHGGVNRREALPERLLGAGPGQPEARGEPGRGVAAPLGQVRVPDPGEHGAGDPGDQEGLQVALDRLGEELVTLPACGTGVGIVDAPGRAHEHEAAEARGVEQGEVERDASPQGVAEEVVVAVARGLLEEGRALGEVGADLGGTSVPGKVDADELAILAEELAEAPPEAPGLGEAVGQDEARAVAEHRCVEHLG